jgi:hypothetical protein
MNNVTEASSQGHEINCCGVGGGRSITIVSTPEQEETLGEKRIDEECRTEGSTIFSGENDFVLKLNHEWLRVIGLCVLLYTFLVGAIMTTTFVDRPSEESAIYHIYGFNHMVNVISHSPSREVCALMIILFILPMVGFVVFSHLRTRVAFQKGEVPRSLHLYSKIATPINVILISYSYMWFVNLPDGDYGLIAHYLPYAGFQLGIGLIAIEQVLLKISTGNIPFDFSTTSAQVYLWTLIISTVLYQVVGFIQIAGVIIIDEDTARGIGLRIFVQVVMIWYTILSLIMQIVLSIINTKDGRSTSSTITLSF